MSIASAIGNAFVSLLPARNETLYRFCRRIVNRYRGDNDGDMRTNGELMLLRRAIAPGAVVFDVGANVGDWTHEALALQPDCRIHCFEPSPTTFARLSARHFTQNVVLNNLGLGAERGRLELFVFADGLGANSLYDRRGTDAETQRRESVEITTLDDYCAGAGIASIDVLKIDVEGHELAVLRGARRLLAEERVAVTQFEYGGTYLDARVSLREVFEYVASLATRYSMFKLLPNAMEAYPAYRQSIETFQYSNWAIMTPETARRIGVPVLLP